MDDHVLEMYSLVDLASAVSYQTLTGIRFHREATMAKSLHLGEMAANLTTLADREVPEPGPGPKGHAFGATVTISIDDQRIDGAEPDDPEFALFWAKLALEAGKIIAAGIAGAIGAALADEGGGNCKTTETTTTTTHPDGSSTTKTVKETTCTAT